MTTTTSTSGSLRERHHPKTPDRLSGPVGPPDRFFRTTQAVARPRLSDLSPHGGWGAGTLPDPPDPYTTRATYRGLGVPASGEKNESVR